MTSALPLRLGSILAFSLIFCSGALAESGYYRIELLLFSHLESAAEAQQLEELRPFTEFPSLDDPLVSSAPIKLEVMSSTMQDAWRRLRLSADFRPLLFAAWEQTRIDYHPPVRIHDEETIAERLEFPYPVAYIDLRSPVMFERYIAPYYRLDGTVQLLRSRFLHLNLDLEYRQELLPRLQTLPASREEAVELAMDPPQSEDLQPGPALVHALQQSRQVRTGEMQYFDTPFLGVLARVTATSGE